VPLRSDRARVQATLDIDGLRRLVERFEQLSGAPAGVYTVTVTALVHARGRLGEAPVAASMRLPVAFQLDATRLRVTPGTSLARTVGGSAPAPRPAPLQVGPMSVRRVPAELLALVVGIAAAAGLALVLVVLRRHGPDDPDDDARRRYGSRLLEILTP